MKYRKKLPLLEANQWFRNGDHPEDKSEPIDAQGRLSEGKVVQFSRSLDALESMDALNSLSLGNRFCPTCGNMMKKHGVLDGVNGEEYVCPGDYIVTDQNGDYYRVNRGEFESQYEPYVRPPRYADKPLSDLEQQQRSKERA